VLFLAALSCGEGKAETWPSRPVVVVVPFAAGGSVDVAARLIAQDLSDKLGQSFIVENKPGAGGSIASVYVAKAPADGYTLLFTASGPAVYNKLLYKSIPYDPDTQFTPVVLTNDVPQVLVVNQNLPVNSIKELVEYSKKKDGGLTIGHAGLGTTGHLASVLFLAQTGIKAILVSYRGASPLITDVMGNHVDVGFPSYIPQVNTVKSLGVTSTERLPFLPGVPTVRESGVSDVVAGTWNALYGPAGMSREIVDKLNSVINNYLKTQDAQTRFAVLGARTLGGTPEQLVAFMGEEKEKWGKVIRDQNIVLDSPQ
jgi:tripartite-type tricarboxylate transporter receptor subunit TctC